MCIRDRFKILFLTVTVTVLLVVGINATIKAKNAREISKEANIVFEQVEDNLRKSEDNFVADRAAAETYHYQAEKALGEVPEELGTKAVSYTHLDVYKRQAQNYPEKYTTNSGCWPEEAITVSYTHLAIIGLVICFISVILVQFVLKNILVPGK